MTRTIRAASRGPLRTRGLLLLAALITACCAPTAGPTAATRPSPPPATAATSAQSAPPSAPASAPPPPAAAAASARPAPLSPPVTLNVALLGGGAEIGIYLALERGYFTEEGLKIDVQEFRSASDEIAPLAAGQLDVGNGGINSGLFNAIAQGIPLKVVANQVMNTSTTQATVTAAGVSSGVRPAARRRVCSQLRQAP